MKHWIAVESRGCAPRGDVEVAAKARSRMGAQKPVPAARATKGGRACTPTQLLFIKSIARFQAIRRSMRKKGETPEPGSNRDTERTAIKDTTSFARRLKAFLRDKGFRFAVDDAGSGYAALAPSPTRAPTSSSSNIS